MPGEQEDFFSIAKNPDCTPRDDHAAETVAADQPPCERTGEAAAFCNGGSTGELSRDAAPERRRNWYQAFIGRPSV